VNNKQKQPRTEPTLDPVLAQYAPKPKLPDYLNPKIIEPDASSDDLKAKIDDIVDEVTGKKSPPGIVEVTGVNIVAEPPELPPAPQLPETPEPEPTKNMLKAKQLVDGLIESAEAQFSAAQSNLERAKQYGKIIQQKIDEEEARSRDFDKRLAIFGKDSDQIGELLVQMYDRFHGK
jgi:hypothetical protein